MAKQSDERLADRPAEQQPQQQPQKPSSAIAIVRESLGQLKGELLAALPPQITVEKFVRVALTAVQANPELLECDRRTLFKAMIQAATDGLLPDGKQGAIVARYNGRTKGKDAAWQPMITGIRMKVRQSGEIATWDVVEVHESDEFHMERGDSPRIHHVPALRDRGALVGVYSIAELKTGQKSREYMSIDEIHAIRDQFSTGWKAFVEKKVRTTPWATSEGQMACKTVALRHSKVLPMSTDIMAFVHRAQADDSSIGSATGAVSQVGGVARRSLTQRFDALAAGMSEQREPAQQPARDVIPPPQDDESQAYDPDTGEVHEAAGAPTGEPADRNEAPVQESATPAAEQRDQPQRGKQTIESGRPKASSVKSGAADLLADLKRTAIAKVAEGYQALRYWLDNDLTAAEEAVIPPEMRVEWERLAKAKEHQ